MKPLEELKELPYRVVSIPLNANLDKHKVILDVPTVYFTKMPIAVQAQIGGKDKPSFTLTSVQIMKAPEGFKFGEIYLTTSTTSTEEIELILIDTEIFADIGIEDRVVLIDPSGVEYDGRLVKGVVGNLFNLDAYTTTDLKTKTLNVSSYNKMLITYKDTHDQIGSIKIYGIAEDGTDHLLKTIATTIGTDTGYETLTDSWQNIKVTYQPSVNPTTGSITVNCEVK